ncbi:GAK system CofD-like protein [Catenovulum agarivorans]|uniref:GAK system CofD-like protein n=1 Tax=Catenovulum agarivorans TaxID=1172192 RepID=UPI00030BBF6A|nr:GAK system CofD-like protein [Catenovulum agarivorans]
MRINYKPSMLHYGETIMIVRHLHCDSMLPEYSHIKFDVTSEKNITQTEHSPHYNQPSMVFFSGGSALAGFSQALKHYNQNHSHIITTLDSGGCTAKLRQCFLMPAIGDIRNRLLALADDSRVDVAAMTRIMALRFAKQGSPATLRQSLWAFSSSDHPMYAQLNSQQKVAIQSCLEYFAKVIPDDFDLRNTSIGNVCIAAAYLTNNRSLTAAIAQFSQLLAIKGQVVPMLDNYCHLAAHLTNGQIILGQHNLTGKEVSPIRSKIARVELSSSAEYLSPLVCATPEHVKDTVKQARLICYPPGSFYSSLITNLLTQGIGKAISQSKAKKVYVPNLQDDPEQIGMSLFDCITTLLNYLTSELSENMPVTSVLNTVLIDKNAQNQLTPAQYQQLSELGIEVEILPLVSQQSSPFYDPHRLSQALLSLCR